jgi:hypothetical protein
VEFGEVEVPELERDWIEDYGESVELRSPDPAEHPSEYEAAVMRRWPREILSQRFPERKVSLTVPGKRRPSGGRSTRKHIRLNSQMQMRKGELTGGKRRPDMRALIPVQDPKTGLWSDEAHIFEATLQTQYAEKKASSAYRGKYGTAPTSSQEKGNQLIFTIQQAVTHPQFAKASLIRYTILAPPPHPSTAKLIDDYISTLNKRFPPRVEIRWRIIRK